MNEGGALTPDRQVMTCLLPAKVSAGKRHVFLFCFLRNAKGTARGLGGVYNILKNPLKVLVICWCKNRKMKKRGGRNEEENER